MCRYAWVTQGFPIRGSQAGFSCSPQSRLHVLGCCCISMVSKTFLFQRCCSEHLTFAPLQSTVCWCSQTCAAIPFFISFLFTAYWCSRILSFRFLPILPKLIALTTGYLVDDIFLWVFINSCLHSHQWLPQFVSRLKDGLYSKLSTSSLNLLTNTLDIREAQ